MTSIRFEVDQNELFIHGIEFKVFTSWSKAQANPWKGFYVGNVKLHSHKLQNFAHVWNYP